MHILIGMKGHELVYKSFSALSMPCNVRKWALSHMRAREAQISLRVYITKIRIYNFDTLKPHLYSKTGVYRGIHYFSYFCSKYRVWVLVRTEA